MASRARSRGARWRRGPQVPARSGERPDSRGSGSGAAGGLPRAGGALRPRERGLRAPFSPRLSGSEKWSPGSRLRRDSVKLTLVLRSALRPFFSRFALCPFSCVLVPHAGDHTSISAPRSGWEPPAPSSSQGRHECFSSPQRPLFLVAAVSVFTFYSLRVLAHSRDPGDRTAQCRGSRRHASALAASALPSGT